MSDAEIRALERAVKDDPSDTSTAVALLAAQLRAGRVPQERAILAARLGDPVARSCCAFGSPLDWIRLEDRVEALSALARATVVGLACDWAESVLPIWEAAYPSDARPRLAIEAARAWVANPSRETARAAAEAAEAAEAAGAAAWAAAWAAGAAGAAAWAAGDAWAARAAWAAWAARAAWAAWAAWAAEAARATWAAWAAWAAEAARATWAAADRQRLAVIRALLTPEDPS